MPNSRPWGVVWARIATLSREDGLEGLPRVGVAAVLIGRLPEGKALIVAGIEELGDSVVAELAAWLERPPQLRVPVPKAMHAAEFGLARPRG